MLANEQVVDGKCERCGEAVVRKDMTQWFLKITDYAEELLDGLSTLDWPEKTKLMQKNWIGKSTGCEVNFECETGDTVTVFTTRPDTLFGVDYVVLAPEHPLVKKLKEAHPERAADIDALRSVCGRGQRYRPTFHGARKDGHFFGRLRHASPHG